jgi:hypothetical protein
MITQICEIAEVLDVDVVDDLAAIDCEVPSERTFSAFVAPLPQFHRSRRIMLTPIEAMNYDFLSI